MDDLDLAGLTPKPDAARPMLGLTILVVEDSRFASEALRLMCLRSGARIRRADCLRSARRHLQVYRPSAVLIDLGLPDGPGLALIEELNRATPRVGAILAISGDPFQQGLAKAAGADGFLVKPVETIGQFQTAILSALPDHARRAGPRTLNTDRVDPDPIAYREDMCHVANLLDENQSDTTIDYVTQFLSSVARSAADDVLEEAASDLIRTRAKGGVARAKLAALAGLVHERAQMRLAI